MTLGHRNLSFGTRNTRIYFKVNKELCGEMDCEKEKWGGSALTKGAGGVTPSNISLAKIFKPGNHAL